jgi:hypothetical protein
VVYVSGGGAGWADVAVVDSTRGSVLARWGGVWAKSFLALTPDGSRLLTATQGVTPGRVEAWPIPEPITDKPTARAAPAGAAVGGPVTVTPDGRFALCPTGAVLRLSATGDDDLHPAGDVGPFVSAAVAPDRGAAFVLREDGVLDVFSYPEFKPRATYRTGVIPFGAALDAAAGRLFVTGVPPAALRGPRPERAPADVRMFDVAPGR